MARFGRGFIGRQDLPLGVGAFENVIPQLVKPTATTNAASSVTGTSATLNGTVNPNGQQDCTVHFDWGLTNAYGNSTGNQDAGVGTNNVAVSAGITGLAAGSTYHFRVVAVNADGTTLGTDQTFVATAVQLTYNVTQRELLKVLLDGQDVTALADGLTFSAADPGGFEASSLRLPESVQVRKGRRLTIQDGLGTAWDGRVGEVQRTIDQSAVWVTVAGEGYGAALKDGAYSMIYVDRDLTRWTGPGTARQVALVTAGTTVYTPQTVPDATNGKPCEQLQMQGPWNASGNCEAWYDAGPANVIASVYYDYQLQGTGGGSWTVALFVFQNDDATGTTNNTGNVGTVANSTGTGTLTATTPVRFALAQLAYSAANATAASYLANLRNLAVYGNHGLTGRGSNPVGFYPSDIARHALAQSQGVAAGVIVDATNLIVPHYVQYTPVTPETVVADMAKLTGWHWGTWEPAGLLDDRPRFHFRPPPASWTASVASRDLNQLDVTDRLSGYYSTAKITYTDAAGTQGVAIVTVPSQDLADAGIQRTLTLDMGTGSAAAAAAYGSYVLQLTNRAARAAGSATLPAKVRLPGGGTMPSYLLRPGIDRLRITDLPGAGRPLFDDRGADVFHVKRVETSVDQTGVPQTRVEFDEGANLVEVLQARLDLFTKAAGG